MSTKLVFKRENALFFGSDVYDDTQIFCLHCGHTYPASQLKEDFTGARMGCGSKGDPDCDGAGLGVDLRDAKSDFGKGCMEQWGIDPTISLKYGTGEEKPPPKQDTNETKSTQEEVERQLLNFFFEPTGLFSDSEYEKEIQKKKDKLFKNITRQELISMETIISTFWARSILDKMLQFSAPQEIIEAKLENYNNLLRGTEVYSPVALVALQKILSKDFDDSIKIHNDKKTFLAEIFQKWSHIKSKKEDVYASGRILPGSAFSKQ
jgi:hypothetical protein